MALVFPVSGICWVYWDVVPVLVEWGDPFYHGGIHSIEFHGSVIPGWDSVGYLELGCGSSILFVFLLSFLINLGM